MWMTFKLLHLFFLLQTREAYLHIKKVLNLKKKKKIP